jgi:hypothetical protein
VGIVATEDPEVCDLPVWVHDLTIGFATSEWLGGHRRVSSGNRRWQSHTLCLPVASPSTSRVFAIIGIRGLTFHLGEEEEEEEVVVVVVVVVVMVMGEP